MAPNPVTITYGRAWIGSRQVTGVGVRRHGSEKVLFLQLPVPRAVRRVWQQVDPDDYVALSNPLDERVIRDSGVVAHLYTLDLSADDG